MKNTTKRTVYSATTCGELSFILGSFMPDMRIVMEDGTPGELYYRIQSDGEGVLVAKPLHEPQRADPLTNDGLFERYQYLRARRLRWWSAIKVVLGIL